MLAMPAFHAQILVFIVFMLALQAFYAQIFEAILLKSAAIAGFGLQISWIFVAFLAPKIAASAVFLIYAILTAANIFRCVSHHKIIPSIACFACYFSQIACYDAWHCSFLKSAVLHSKSA